MMAKKKPTKAASAKGKKAIQKKPVRTGKLKQKPAAKKKKRHVVAARAYLDIDDPENPPDDTNVLDYTSNNSTDFFISCEGEVHLTGGRYLQTVWAKTYTRPLPATSPYLRPPYEPDPTGTTPAFVPPNSHEFNHLGSNHSDGDGYNHLIPVADPDTYPRQYLYVWGLMSDGTTRPEPDDVVLQLVVTHRTNAGDTSP